jgi:DNA-binding NarL/FixJ family response regulator
MIQPVIIFTENRPLLTRAISILEPVSEFRLHCHVESLLELEVILQKESHVYLLIDSTIPALGEDDFFTQCQRFRTQVTFLYLWKNHPPKLLSELLFLGVQGLIGYDQLETYLPTALKTCAEKRCYMDEALLVKLAVELKQENKSMDIKTLLSEREIQVLKLILQEKSNTVIADELFISIHTVNSHRKNIFRKLKVRSIIGLLQVVGNYPI